VSATMAPSGGSPLKLRIADAADLEVASTLLQDALVPVGDIAWLQEEGRFVMAASDSERVLAGVSFGAVTAVRLRDIDPGRRDLFLSLLAIVVAPGDGEPVIDIAFAGTGGTRPTIRIAATRLDGLVEDFGESWPTSWRPAHARA